MTRAILSIVPSSRPKFISPLRLPSWLSSRRNSWVVAVVCDATGEDSLSFESRPFARADSADPATVSGVCVSACSSSPKACAESGSLATAPAVSVAKELSRGVDSRPAAAVFRAVRARVSSRSVASEASSPKAKSISARSTAACARSAPRSSEARSTAAAICAASAVRRSACSAIGVSRRRAGSFPLSEDGAICDGGS